MQTEKRETGDTMNNELIEAAKAVIGRWDSTDWKAAPTAEVMNRLRAALSAKLPEVEEWIASENFHAYYEKHKWDDDIQKYREDFTAAHAAELAAIEHERSGVEGAMYARILALEAELANLHAKIGDESGR
jgi:hypothetical protein